ncbi:ribosomal RNA small subunit methyltransferase A2 [Plasmodium brasilianum]|uniref:rRNA adenine N(6)-methyltransferase n=2 Tax=Plasmodium (Plasmodium) TaxID=418103 RepID=A0A1A8WEQ2_PLAMA|nr:apicoplast dimethyladenosine synthase, putative [Plasmodium malariae]KAI4835186.1 ribosomal RNA small subunit methyltransferase A2 [Plasmodium brasilianum]SBS91444.1 dimethyladenosine transferase, putative [Plasmodium malariae]SCP03770.1 apicoplast dimethyladenosine synthase, putative [Plasmodium malariae]
MNKWAAKLLLVLLSLKAKISFLREIKSTQLYVDYSKGYKTKTTPLYNYLRQVADGIKQNVKCKKALYRRERKILKRFNRINQVERGTTTPSTIASCQKSSDEENSSYNENNNEESNDDGNNGSRVEDRTKNILISRSFQGIKVYPIRQPGEENPLRTKIPAMEFKPKRSLGQNYLKDENIIRKMVSAIELNVNDLNSKSNKINVQKKKKREKNGRARQPGKFGKNKKIVKGEEHNEGELYKENKHKKGEVETKWNTGKSGSSISTNGSDSYSGNDYLGHADNYGGGVPKEEPLESVQNKGKGIIELGCGLGQISKFLFAKYENMTGVEIDSRAISILSRTMPGFDIIHDDVLQINYKEMSLSKGTKLTVIGNLPFYITSQILFCLLDFYKYIEQAIVTIQYEVGQRIVAKPNDKDYSILSILFSIYTEPHLLFKIPSTAFYPVPKVEAAIMKIIFKKNDFTCNLLYLKQILKYAFQQKRKKLKSSLKTLLNEHNIEQTTLPFSDLRPQQLYPYQFIELTNILFPLSKYPFDPKVQTKVWRKKKHGE